MVVRFTASGWRRMIGGFVGIALVSVAQPAAAQVEAEPVPLANDDASRGWTVVVSPYVWGASLGGDIGLAGLQSDIHLPFSEIFENLSAVAMGNVEVAHGKLGGYVDAQYVRTSQDEEVLSLPVNLGVTITRVAGGVFYKAWEIPLGGETAAGRPRTVSIEPTLGLRWTDLRARVAVPALALDTSRTSDWIDPFAGVRVNADLSRHWNLAAEADVGGFGIGGASDISVNAQAYLGYRTRLFAQPVILRAGYRLLYQKYDQPDFTGQGTFLWDMQQRGPVLGISMIF